MREWKVLNVKNRLCGTVVKNRWLFLDTPIYGSTKCKRIRHFQFYHHHNGTFLLPFLPFCLFFVLHCWLLQTTYYIFTKNRIRLPNTQRHSFSKISLPKTFFLGDFILFTFFLVFFIFFFLRFSEENYTSSCTHPQHTYTCIVLGSSFRILILVFN